MARNLELNVVAGPMKGERYPLAPDRSTKIGRASRGVNLTLDDHASLDHAEIYPRQEQYWIVDLGSHTGTFVNGDRVGDEPVPVEVGSVIEVGSTVLRLEAARATSRLVGYGIAIAVPILTTVVMLVFFATRPVEYFPALVHSEPVRQLVRTSSVVPVPLDFVRRRGVDHRGMQLRRVTDFDGDGVDEIWVRVRDDLLAITFNERGEWVVFGEFPQDCVERSYLDFPDRLCNGLVYRYRDGAYQPAGVEGVITWVRPWEALNPEAAADPETEVRYGPGRLRPHRMTLPHPDRLKGFLAARGIDEPVHYLICEEAVSGMRAQVLTASGDVEPLDYGCLGGLRLSGSGWEDELGGEKPQAFAFTVTGYEALIDDVATFLSGGPDGLFLAGGERRLMDAFSAAPANRPGLRVTFLGEPTEGRVVPADEGNDEVHLLARSGVAAVRPPSVTVANVRTSGVAHLDPPGCSELEVSTERWHCKLLKWCLPGRTFLRVEQTGCGTHQVLAEVPYTGGYWRAGDGQVDLAISVDVASGRGQLDVLRTRVAFRVPDAESAARDDRGRDDTP